MISGKILLSTIIVIFTGIFGSFIYTKCMRTDFFGGLKAGMIVGVTGAILGGYIFDLIFRLSFLQDLINIPYLKYLLVNQFDINFIAVCLGVLVFLLFYDYVSKHTERS